MSKEGAGGASGSANAWSATKTRQNGPAGPSGSVWNGTTQRQGSRDSSSSGIWADGCPVRADSGSMHPSTHHRALTVTVSKTTMAQALITSALYTIPAAERVNQGTVHSATCRSTDLNG